MQNIQEKERSIEPGELLMVMGSFSTLTWPSLITLPSFKLSSISSTIDLLLSRTRRERFCSFLASICISHQLPAVGDFYLSGPFLIATSHCFMRSQTITDTLLDITVWQRNLYQNITCLVYLISRQTMFCNCR